MSDIVINLKLKHCFIYLSNKIQLISLLHKGCFPRPCHILFSISIHNRSSLSDTEKLVYLWQSPKDGTAKKVIEGPVHWSNLLPNISLWSSQNNPPDSPQEDYQNFLTEGRLWEGTLLLHDTAQQEPSRSFITSMLELKLDQNTMFEWQKHSQESTEIPHYKDLLEFINFRAQASECMSSETKKVTRSESRRYPPGKSITSFAAYTTDINCTLCKNESTLSTYALTSNLFLETKWCRRVNSVSIAFAQDISPGSVPVWTDAGNVKNLIIHSFTEEDDSSQSDKGSQSTTETTVSSNTAAWIVSTDDMSSLHQGFWWFLS